MVSYKTLVMGSAYSAFDEHRKGSITPGKLADVAVLDHDVTTIDSDAIADVGVAATMVGGRFGYDPGGLSS